MRNLQLLITLDQQEEEHATYLLNYHIGTSLARDRWGEPRLLARQCSASGWQMGAIPLLSGRGPAQGPAEFLPGRQGARLSLDGRWLWKPHPQAPWPAPGGIVQVDRKLQRSEVVWKRDDWEVLDLQLDGDGQGLLFAVRNPEGRGQLWHWCPRRRHSQMMLESTNFYPLEFAVHPSGRSLAFVDQNDDQIYSLSFGSKLQKRLSQPHREQEAADAPGIYRCSPAFSPDGTRLFYCTAYLEVEGGNLTNAGHLYVTATSGGRLRRIELGDHCPVNLCLPPQRVFADLAIAS